MGRIVKQVSEGTTKYYWYPGDKKDWIRAGVAVGVGLFALGMSWFLIRHVLAAATIGIATTTATNGVNFGRREARAFAGFPGLGDKAARRATMGQTGRAAWRAMVKGFIGAAAAVLILNLPQKGIVADWILPVVPAMVGALAHQGGMLYERLKGVDMTTAPVAAQAGSEAAVPS